MREIANINKTRVKNSGLHCFVQVQLFEIKVKIPKLVLKFYNIFVNKITVKTHV